MVGTRWGISSEYGLFRGEQRLAGETEEGLYRALALDWITPELREDRGEVEAAREHTLPLLIERADLRGDLHVHTNASDGQDSLERIVAAAQAQKLSYIAITDHARHIGIVHGLDAQRLAQQGEAIDALNERLNGFTILKGDEVDILEDGRLALPDAVLATLDVVVLAVHDRFNLSEAEQTSRILRAIARPHVCILAHPSGRLLGKREPYALDFEQVLEAVRERGVLLSIASDAHSADQFANLDGGVRQARRGWTRRQDVLNALPIAELRGLLRHASA